MTTTITLPLTEEQAVAIVVAADAFGVEPWEMAVHVLDFKRRFRARHIDGYRDHSEAETTNND